MVMNTRTCCSLTGIMSALFPLPPLPQLFLNSSSAPPPLPHTRGSAQRLGELRLRPPRTRSDDRPPPVGVVSIQRHRATPTEEARGSFAPGDRRTSAFQNKTRQSPNRRHFKLPQTTCRWTRGSKVDRRSFRNDVINRKPRFFNLILKRQFFISAFNVELDSNHDNKLL